MKVNAEEQRGPSVAPRLNVLLAAAVVGIVVSAIVVTGSFREVPASPGASQLPAPPTKQDFLLELQNSSWPEGYTNQQKVAELADFLASMKRNLTEAEQAVAASEAGSAARDRFQLTVDGLRNHIAAVEEFIARLESAS